MHAHWTSVAIALLGLHSAGAVPSPQADYQFQPAKSYPNNTFVSPYTLTIFAPSLPLYHGLKVQVLNGLSVFQSKSTTYCPSGQSCGTETDAVFSDTLDPSVKISGGQDTYILNSGLFQISAPNAKSLPSGSKMATTGLFWTPFPNMSLPNADAWRLPNCVTTSSWYDCTVPVGIYSWNANGYRGMYACPNEKNLLAVSIYAKVSFFPRIGCFEITGLGTHGYAGATPAVYAYN